MALNGSIDSFPIADVLRLLGSTAKSGRLTLDGDRGRGSVWFDEGQMVGGEATSIRSPAEPPVETVIFDLFRFDSGSFEFEAGAEPASRTEPLDVAATIDIAETMLEEFRAVTAVIPGISTWMRLSVPLGRSHVTLDEHQWAAVVAIGSGASVDQVGDALGLTELDVLRMARDLSDVGVAEICDPPVPSTTPAAVNEPTASETAVAAATPAGTAADTAPPAEPAIVFAPEAEVAESEPAPDPAFEAPPAPAPVFKAPPAPAAEPERVAFDVAAEAPPAPETSGDDLFTAVEPEPFDAGTTPAEEPATVFAMPAADADPAPPGSNGDSSGSSMDEIFGEFDPFGDGSTPSDDDLFAPLPDPPAAFEAPAVDAGADASGAPADEESLEAQMAMLSPAAAEAIAAARRSATPAAPAAGAEPGDDADRGAVGDYLGQL